MKQVAEAYLYADGRAEALLSLQQIIHDSRVIYLVQEFYLDAEHETHSFFNGTCALKEYDRILALWKAKKNVTIEEI